MTTRPYPLYGNNCRAYLVLMSQYNSGKSREYTQILSYLDPDTGINYGNVTKDPPWKGSLSKYLNDHAPDEDISFLLYLPIRKNEEMWIQAEMIRWRDMKTIGNQNLTYYKESDTSQSDASKPVHFTSPAHDWGHARIEISTSDKDIRLRDMLEEGGALEYYLVRLTQKSRYNTQLYHWEDTGILEVDNDL